MRASLLFLAALAMLATGCGGSQSSRPMDQPTQAPQSPGDAGAGMPVDEAAEAHAGVAAPPICGVKTASDAEPGHDAADSRGARPRPAPPSLDNAFDYPHKWALIVGIDYTDHPDSRTLRPLESAENDAKAVYEVLVTNYGYRPGETAFLLLGSTGDLESRATKSNIEGFLERLVRSTEDHSQDSNSVLFYFAGHGENFRDRSSIAGELYPVDTQVFASGKINPGTTLAMAAVSRYLESCKAFHKLIVLDCCYSGLLFEAMDSLPRNRSSVLLPTRGELVVPATVGLTAGKQDETVPDVGRILEGHSPFTGALLLGLRTGLGDRSTTPFSSLELYTFIQRKINEHNARHQIAADRIRQIPQYGKEPRGAAADFYFIPSRDFQRELVHPKERKLTPANDAETLAVAFATFPGLTGRQWWFEEVPWMLPELRREPRHLPEQVIAHRPIDGQLSLDANMLATLDPASLRKVLYSSFERYHEELRARELQLRRAGMVASLEEDIRESVADPAKQDELLAEIRSLGDLHLLALVQHRFKRPEAESTYRDALQQYETEKTPLRDCLYALCWADLGRVQADNNAWRESASSFRRARNQVGGLGPQAATFRVSARLREIWATRKVARTRDDWSKLNEAMTEAFREADESQLPQSHWLYACLHEERAWLFMEQWMVTEAKQNFERARLIREEAMGIADAKDKPTLQMACFHNEHGHAMASLFSGEVDAAKLAYEEVFSNMEQLRERSDSASRDEDVIIRRLHNTAERLGDLYLLSMRPQPAKALHWYAGSLEYARLLTSGDTKTPQVKLLYKRAIAASLEGRFEVAVEAISSAGAIELGDNQQKECEVFRRVAEACRRLATKEQAEVELARRDLREILNAAVPGRTTEASQGGGLARGYDSLTFLMFAWGRLIDSRRADDPQGADDPDLLSDAALLFRICPERLSDPAAFRHFKPYHDVAIVLRTTAESVEDPADVVCHIWLANTGGFPVWPQRNSQLLFHYPASMDQPNFAVLYRPDQSPAAAFRRFVLAESEADVDKAVRQNAELSLPDSLRDALQTMESEVRVVWPPCLGTCPYSVPGKSKVSP